MIEIDTGLMRALPDYYKGIADYEQILNSEEAELDILAAFIQQVHSNYYLQTMDEATTQSWEELLNIPPASDASLSFRRQRVLNRITTRPPFSLGFLYKKLDELIGPGKWEVALDYDDYTLYIETAAESQDYAIEVAYTVNQIKPAHIVYINRALLSDIMLLSETIGASVITQNYRLGSWALGSGPFAQEGAEVNYKMATTRSLTDTLINAVAGFVSSDVAKARINSSSVITTLTKSTSSGVLTVQYVVPSGTVNTITKVELLDSSNNVLTSSTVYIPAASAVEMKHRIITQEGA